MNTQNAVVRAALAGAATGSRSMTGLAALTLTTPGGATGQPDRLLARTWVKALVSAGAAGELVADKLPRTPSRLAPPSLGARFVAGAVAGFIIARRATPADEADLPSPAATVTAAAVSAGAALATTWLGARWRRAAAGWFGTDYVGAGLEDAGALALAWAATR